MQDNQKEEIVKLLRQRKDDRGLSLKELASMSKAGSESTLSDVLSGVWKTRQHIGDKIWNKLASWLNYNSWVISKDTSGMRMITAMCKHVKRSPQALALISEPGLGKSEGLKLFADTTKETFYIECCVFWNRKTFLNELLVSLGEAPMSEGIPVIFNRIVELLRYRTRPLIIIDEMDKLKDGVIDLFNALYNASKNHCGFIISGAPYLRKRIQKGVAKDRQSFKEIYSRVGGEFNELANLSVKDIRLICNINGIDDQEQITDCIEQANNDLRRVKNLIDKLKVLNENESEATNAA